MTININMYMPVSDKIKSAEITIEQPVLDVAEAANTRLAIQQDPRYKVSLQFMNGTFGQWLGSASSLIQIPGEDEAGTKEIMEMATGVLVEHMVMDDEVAKVAKAREVNSQALVENVDMDDVGKDPDEL